MNKRTFSLHEITDPVHLSFSAEEYSKFKFGSKKIAKKFGEELAQGFIYSVLRHHTSPVQYVVISSPYSFIPTATFAMKDYFINVINVWLTEHNMSPVEETKIYRTITYKEDYGSLSAVERLALIGNDKFHIDREFVKGKTLLFLDDVKITGSHEWVVGRMCNEYRLTNSCYFLYFAELINDEIDPSFENALNYAFVEDVLDLDFIIKNENFLINTRVVKFILNSNYHDCRTFLQFQSVVFLETLYHAALGNGYHTIPEYQVNLNNIKNILKFKKENYELGFKKETRSF